MTTTTAKTTTTITRRPVGAPNARVESFVSYEALALWLSTFDSETAERLIRSSLWRDEGADRWICKMGLAADVLRVRVAPRA